MSRGSERVTVRLPADLLARIERQVSQRNHYTREQPWNLSDFLRAAAEEKLSKMSRSRAPRPRKPR